MPLIIVNYIYIYYMHVDLEASTCPLYYIKVTYNFTSETLSRKLPNLSLISLTHKNWTMHVVCAVYLLLY